jgi:hypothetical protein
MQGTKHTGELPFFSSVLAVVDLPSYPIDEIDILAAICLGKPIDPKGVGVATKMLADALQWGLDHGHPFSEMQGSAQRARDRVQAWEDASLKAVASGSGSSGTKTAFQPDFAP